MKSHRREEEETEWRHDPVKFKMTEAFTFQLEGSEAKGSSELSHLSKIMGVIFLCKRLVTPPLPHPLTITLPTHFHPAGSMLF